MKIYRADLHIHTLLSPCGELSMSPAIITEMASRRNLDIIGISDHNTTRQSGLVRKLAEKKGIFVLRGAEVTTREEVHCLAFFEDNDTLDRFQELLDDNLPAIPNNPLIFGDQIVVDENENIIYTEERLLTNAVTLSLEELEEWVHDNEGIFIPAHIDRMKNSLYSQLGFLPENLKADALEVSKRSSPSKFRKSHPETAKYTLITNSDSHYPESIGTAFNNFLIEKITFEEIRMALAGKNGRNIN